MVSRRRVLKQRVGFLGFLAVAALWLFTGRCLAGTSVPAPKVTPARAGIRELVEQVQRAFYQSERVEYIAVLDLNNDGRDEVVCATTDWALPALDIDAGRWHVGVLYILKREFIAYAKGLDPGVMQDGPPDRYVILRAEVDDWIDRLWLVPLDDSAIPSIIIQGMGGINGKSASVYRFSKTGKAECLLDGEEGMAWVTDRDVMVNGTQIGQGRVKLLLERRNYDRRDAGDWNVIIIYTMTDGVLKRYGEFGESAVDLTTRNAWQAEIEERHRVLGNRYYLWREEEIWKEYLARKTELRGGTQPSVSAPQE